MKSRTRPSSPAIKSSQGTPEVAAAEVLAWVSDCLEGGLCFIAKGILVFENAQFGELVEAPVVPPGPDIPSLRSHLFTDAIGWNQETLGARGSKVYRLTDRQGHALVYECRFNVVPYHKETGVLLVLQDITKHTELGQPRKSLSFSPCWPVSEHVP